MYLAEDREVAEMMYACKRGGHMAGMCAKSEYMCEYM